MKNTPPTFLELLYASLNRDREEIGIIAYIPFWYLFFCIALPLLIAFKTEMEFKDINLGDVIIVISSISITISGILGAFAISCSIHISTLSSQYPVSDYLIKIDALDEFLLAPQFVIAIQLSTAIYSVFIILASFFVGDKFLVFMLFSVGFSIIMMCTKTWNLISVMRSLTWFNSHIMADYHKSHSTDGEQPTT